MKLRIFILCCLILGWRMTFGALDVNFSNYADQQNFVNNTGFTFSVKSTENHTLGLGANLYRSPSTEILRVYLNIDFWYNQRWSSFILASYDQNQSFNLKYSQIGVGISWLPDGFNQAHVFPFFHKLSYALIQQTDRSEIVHSFRYNCEAVFDRIQLKGTCFYKEFSTTVDLEFQYKISQWVSILHQYRFYRYETQQEVINITGIKLHL